ncbi:MAG: PQQ-binding-like beta-propeller repeat protein, partial [Caldisericia bacterium]|nr:PQQ-binding-like beta-propeller repeat protein [Caldisericia bacterium]
MKLIRIVAVFITGLFILSAGSFVSSGNISLWNSWRGNVGRTCRIEIGGHVRSLLVFDWKISIGNRFCVHPVTWNRKVFVGNSKFFYALDNSTGSIIWRYSGEYKTTHTPSFGEDKIYLTHHKDGVWNIISLAGNNGDLTKKCNMLSEPTFTLVHGGNLFYSIQRESGGKRYSQYYSHNMESGKINWFKRLPGEFTFDCMDDGILFIRNAVYERESQYPPGSIFALDEGDGDILWELEPEKDSSLDGHLISKNGVLYFG